VRQGSSNLVKVPVVTVVPTRTTTRVLVHTIRILVLVIREKAKDTGSSVQALQQPGIGNWRLASHQ
jgi:hypothetical protein